MDAAACRAFHIMKAEMSVMREYVQRVGLKGPPPFGGWEHLRKYDLKKRRADPSRLDHPPLEVLSPLQCP